MRYTIALCLAFVLVSAVWAEEIVVRRLALEDPATISLTLAEDKAFVKNLGDALKSGQALALSYRIELAKPGWWGDTLASTTLVRQVAYHHRENEFSLTEGDVTQRFATLEELIKAVLWVDERVMLLKEQAKEVGQELEMVVTLRFAPEESEEGWLDWLALDLLWETTTMRWEEAYIVR
jgi:hypothetical protein